MRSRPRLPIQGRGEITAIPDPRHFQIRMANGFTTRAHLDRKFRDTHPEITTGTRVWLEFSPYDMTQPRIIGIDTA